ncbi:MAG TPA: hypothetical protein VI583_04205 [Cyclobacteriaceae bacterium]|nr:hypothetical protein [Cyclobacteriaceae bacterium]
MIINLLSGPRNLSTALMYSFAQRNDTLVMDEPLYGYYLAVSGADHPGRDEVLAAMELDHNKVFSAIDETGKDGKIIFIKNMCHHFVGIPLSMINGFKNIFLIRNPSDMLPSLSVKIPRPTIRDTGLKDQWEIYNHLRSAGQSSAVIDAEHLSNDPELVLKKLCQNLGIPFSISMLSWKKGPRKEDGIWAKYWYQSVHNSTGFDKYVKKNLPLSANLENLLSECMSYYRKLYEHILI